MWMRQRTSHISSDLPKERGKKPITQNEREKKKWEKWAKKMRKMRKMSEKNIVKNAYFGLNFSV